MTESRRTLATHRFRSLAKGLLLSMTLLLSACGSGLSGEYSDEMGMMKYEFESDGKVYMTTMGMKVAGEYEIDDGNVIVKGPHGNLVFERKDDTLIGPMGLTLSKREE